MLTGTNLQHANFYNIRIVLEIIRLHGPLSRVEIARRTQLTAQTVTNITKKLLEAGLIIESDRLQEGRGAPSILLKLRQDAAFSVGLDFDKDHLTGVLVDLSGRIRQRESIDLDFPSPEEGMEWMTNITNSLIRKEGVDRSLVWGVGVGLPGPLIISKGSVVTNIANPQFLPGWNHVPVVQILGERLDLPIFLENNASASAVGERWYGEGQHIGTFFYVFFGAGLGGGLIVNGQLYSGFTGNAGEIGYFPATRLDGSRLELGTTHAGQVFNLPVLFKDLREKGIEIHDAQGLELLFRQRNPAVVQWVEKAVNQLIPLLLSIEYLLDPEVIFFGGRIPDIIIREFLIRLNEKLPSFRIEGKPMTPELRIAKSGQDAAALGVATMPLYNSLAPLPNVLMKGSDNRSSSIKNSKLQ